jgi:hypothetical protein
MPLKGSMSPIFTGSPVAARAEEESPAVSVVASTVLARNLILHISTPQIVVVGSVIRGVKSLQKYPLSAQGCPVIAALATGR